MPASYKDTLDTPCLVIDKHILEKNILLMQQDVNSQNKNLRPHIKSHKCSQIAKMQIAAGAKGVAVAKVSEARVLVEKSINNILITSPVVTNEKIKNLAWCLKNSSGLKVVVDNIDNARALNQMAQTQNSVLEILIDIDPGIGRTGIDHEEIIPFAEKLLELKNLSIQGIQCYAGNLQHIHNFEDRKIRTTQIMEKASTCFVALHSLKLDCQILSGSGTGTYEIDLTIPAVTEVQPGSYAIMDAEYFSIQSNNKGHFDKFKPAMKLLTTIISANKTTHVTCDAGWKALYEVPTAPIILDPPGYLYNWGGFGDEHGKITRHNENKKPLPKLGDVLELMVAHCDPTINMFDNYYIVENGQLVDIWPIDLRGKSQ